MEFEQALSHMKKGGTVKLGNYSYKFARMSGDRGSITLIIESKEGRNYDLTLTAVTLAPKELLSNDWEIAD